MPCSSHAGQPPLPPQDQTLPTGGPLPASTTPKAIQAGVTPDASAVHDPRAWLEHFPASKRSAVANWHHFAVRSGARTPAEVHCQVVQTVQQRLAAARDPETTTHLTRVLEVLRTEQAGALAYAKHVLTYEALPYEARQRVKAERAIHYIRESMEGKPMTPAQLAFLRGLGYRGAMPTDRAAASHLLDQIKRERGLA